MGAIIVHARSRWAPPGCTKYGKSVKARFLKTYVFRCLGMFGVGVISVAVGGSKLAFGGGWGAVSSPKTILKLLGHLFEV